MDLHLLSQWQLVLAQCEPAIDVTGNAANANPATIAKDAPNIFLVFIITIPSKCN